jgi:hypothetical protein
MIFTSRIIEIIVFHRLKGKPQISKYCLGMGVSQEIQSMLLLQGMLAVCLMQTALQEISLLAELLTKKSND